MNLFPQHFIRSQIKLSFAAWWQLLLLFCFHCILSVEHFGFPSDPHSLVLISLVSGSGHLQLTALSPLFLTHHISSPSWDSWCSSLLASDIFLFWGFTFIHFLFNSSYRRAIKHLLCPSQQLTGCFLNLSDTFQFECVKTWEDLEWWYPRLCMSFPHLFLIFAIFFFFLCSKNWALQYALCFQSTSKCGVRPFTLKWNGNCMGDVWMTHKAWLSAYKWR